MEITKSRDHLCSSNLEFQTQHYILFWKYLVDMRSETWLNLFWEYINGKLFAVHKPATPLNVQHTEIILRAKAILFIFAKNLQSPLSQT